MQSVKLSGASDIKLSQQAGNFGGTNPPDGCRRPAYHDPAWQYAPGYWSRGARAIYALDPRNVKIFTPVWHFASTSPFLSLTPPLPEFDTLHQRPLSSSPAVSKLSSYRGTRPRPLFPLAEGFSSAAKANSYG